MGLNLTPCKNGNSQFSFFVLFLIHNVIQRIVSVSPSEEDVLERMIPLAGSGLSTIDTGLFPHFNHTYEPHRDIEHSDTISP